MSSSTSSHVIQEISVASYLEQIYNIMQEAYSIEATLLDVADFFPLNRTRQNIASSNNQFLGCFQDNKLLGLCELENLEKDSTLIASLVVQPKHFRQDVASSLIEFVLNMGQTSSILVSTAENNQPAIKLYEKYGFVLYEQETLPDGMCLVKLCFNCAL